MSSQERNQERAERAEAALTAYFAHVAEERDDEWADLVDLITDSLHLALSRGLDVDSILTAARHNLDAELDPMDIEND